jgi:polyphosphate kinase
MAISLGDNEKARELLPDGSYRRVTPAAGQPLVRSQQRFLEIALQNAARRLTEAPPPATQTPASRPARMRARKRQVK